MPRRGDGSQEINRTAPRSDRPAIALFKSRSWSCSAIHFDVFGQAGLFATLDVRQKFEFAVTPMKHFHYFWVEALPGFSNDMLHGFFQREGWTILAVRCKSVQAVNRREDSRTGRNFLPAQSARITIPIPSLVVGTHDRNDRIRKLDTLDDSRNRGPQQVVGKRPKVTLGPNLPQRFLLGKRNHARYRSGV